VLVAAQILMVANANMIAVALPPLAHDLGASETQQQWVDAYVLVFAALLVAGGVLGDRYGRRRSLIAGLGLFAAGSLACALAPGPGVLIAARVLQGLAPPLVLPASLAIVAASFPSPLERARAVGIWGGGSGVGIALGPLLGGIIVAAFGWRWVFGLSVPAAGVLAVAVVRFVPASRAPGARQRFDGIGAALVTAGMAGIVFGIIEGRERGWTSAAVLVAFAAGAALLVAFVAVERRHPAPLVDLGLLRRRRFVAANLGGAAVMFTLLGTTVFLSAFFQGVRGLTPLETGLALLPLGGATAALAPVAGRATARIAPRTLSAGGMACSALGALLLSRIHAGDTPGDLWPALLLLGAGIGFALPPMTSTAVSAAPGHQAGMASAIHNASRQLGATLGVAVLGSVVFAHASLTSGLRVAFVIAAILLVVVAAVTVLLVPARR
jgi:DHA2 family methylenomycin A resistance protein-like MFS transporter